MQLSATKIKSLKEQLKKSNSANERDRLRSILWHFEYHKTAKEIAKFMYLHEQTIQNYINDYLNEEKTKNDPRGGSSSKLSEEQSQELKGHLNQNTYLKAKDIVAYVKKKYQINYTISGMTFWLNENGFTYKKPVSMPGKLDPEKQEKFIQEYEELKQELPRNEAVIFIDAVHPEHQSKSAFGWILKGNLKHLPSTANQQRMHLIGGLELGSPQKKEHSISILEAQQVNADAAIQFMELLKKKVEKKKVIHIISDNASFFKCKKIHEYLSKNPKIKIKYLPPYSPNLNPIERLWKILREHTQYNKYYEKFIHFKLKVNEFFEKTIHFIKDKIYSRINDRFQIFKPNLIKLAYHSA